MKLVQPTPKTPLTLRLSRDLRRDLKRGHPWVFAESLRQCPTAEAGTPAILLDSRQREVARGFYDANSPLAFRVCNTNDEALDDAWAIHQFRRALTLRQHFLDAQTTGYRLFNGEGDGLPGLVVDIYGDTAVMKLDGAAASHFWQAEGVAEWVAQQLGLNCVYERATPPHSPLNQGGKRGGVGRALIGNIPTKPIEFLENGVRFVADVVVGQKTGFFLDQRDNRQLMRQVAKGQRVLNLFGYTGGFSVYTGLGEAEHVTTVDMARPAIEMAERNWQRNNLPAISHEGIVSDVFEFLSQAAQAKRSWDVVIIDPPSFAPSKSAVAKAIPAYQKLVAVGAAVTAPDGLLAMASCSSHINVDTFLTICEEGVSQARRRSTMLSLKGQSFDHPSPLVFSEFRYLKFALMRVE